MRALCMSDDPWATRPAVELLCAGFTSAKPEIITITPADAGVTKIGHFGFFRPEHRGHAVGEAPRNGSRRRNRLIVRAARNQRSRRRPADRAISTPRPLDSIISACGILGRPVEAGR